MKTERTNILKRSFKSLRAEKYGNYDGDTYFQQGDTITIDHIARKVYHMPSVIIDIAMKAKRFFDILFSIMALIIFSPIILISALLIKLESRGPVFYRQERIGINRRRRDRRAKKKIILNERRNSGDRRKNIMPGKPFTIYKLRTMTEDAESEGPLLAQDNDPRITKTGKLLRKTRIDEIPQFINVVKGDMSIIGPRPERSFFINMVKAKVPEFPLRLRVKPGITGLAQVESGYAQNLSHMSEKLLYDLHYISNLSVYQEIMILFKTIFVVITGKGAC